MHHYWREFLTVALAHLLAVASPGPDFAVVLRQSLRHGRRAGVWTSVGVGAAILLHVTYSLVGLGLLLKSSERIFAVVKYIGAAYVAWLGIQALSAKPRSLQPDVEDAIDPGPSAWSAGLKGFLTNALNPKVALFFVALFVTVIDPATPKLVQAAYGLWMACATAGWFSLVAIGFTRADVRESFLHHGPWVDRVLGVVLLLFAAGLIVSSL